MVMGRDSYRLVVAGGSWGRGNVRYLDGGG